MQRIEVAMYAPIVNKKLNSQSAKIYETWENFVKGNVSILQSIANHFSVFLVDFNELPQYNAARVAAYCLCMDTLIKSLGMLRFPLRIYSF